jgi:hypothetical protein
MIAKETGGTFETAPAGTHVARCFGLIDMGTQTDAFEGRKTIARKVSIRFELPMELQTTGENEGQPFQLSKTYTLSLHKKAGLRGALESWRSRPFTEDELKGFDLRKVMGAPCMLSVIHTEEGKAKIASVSSVVKGMQVPAPVNPTVYFSLDPLEFSQQIYDGLGEWFRNKISESPEYKTLKSGKSQQTEEWNGDPSDDDVPF